MTENNDINDIIIAGDFNQDIRSNEVQKFFTELGVQDVHSNINRILNELIDKININRSWPIDSIAITVGILEYVEGSKLLGNNDVVFSDHRLYLIDVNLEEYFNDQFSY